LRQNKLGRGLSANLYGSSKKVCYTESIHLCANHVCISVRDSTKSSRKEIKEDKGRNIEKVLDCAAPDSLVHGLANWALLGILACIGYNSLDRPHEAPDSPVSQRPTTSGHVITRPIVNRRTRQSRAPRSGNQPIRGFSAVSSVRTVHCPVCTGQSGALTDKKQLGPSKWSSNGS
jgi:hypothetical protein